MKNFPASLQAHINKACEAETTSLAARTCLAHLDLTSLNDTDTSEVMVKLAARGQQGDLGHVAALCVYPQFLSQVFNLLSGTDMQLATVVNFPSGAGTPEDTARQVKAALRDGANEIDIVLDHAALRAGDVAGAAALLKVCRDACGAATMKVILETAEFDDYAQLAAASRLALDAGADFLKTSTGKSAAGGASLDAAAVMLEAIGEGKAGLKVSGGVRTVAEGAQYIALFEEMRGVSVTPATFRIGASGIMDDILHILGRSGAAPALKTGY